MLKPETDQNLIRIVTTKRWVGRYHGPFYKVRAWKGARQYAKNEGLSLPAFIMLDSGLTDIILESQTPRGGVYKWFEKGKPDLAYIGEAAILAKRKQDHSTLDPTTCEFTIWVQQHGGETVFETLEEGWFNKRERLAREKFYIEKFKAEGGVLVNKDYKMWTPPWRAL